MYSTKGKVIPDCLLPEPALVDSEFRRIEIKIDQATKDYPDPSELQVRHRTGYYTMPTR